MSLRQVTARAAPVFRRRCTRQVHTPRPLPYDIKNGMGNFLSPTALRVVAEEYQNGLLSRLNDEVHGTEEQYKSVAQTIINTAMDTTKTLAFNYASLALNNSFFLDNLTVPPEGQTNNEASLETFFNGKIKKRHGSLEQLKSNFSATAMGMTSSGYVWFVTDQWGNTGVLPTFGSGTLLVRARANLSPNPIALGEDMETWGNNTVFADQSGRPISPARPLDLAASRVSGTKSGVAASTKAEYINLGQHIQPLFCISVHEHAWMAAGYGVWGKEEYLKRFWNVLDWAKVQKAYREIARDDTQFAELS